VRRPNSFDVSVSSLRSGGVQRFHEKRDFHTPMPSGGEYLAIGEALRGRSSALISEESDLTLNEIVFGGASQAANPRQAASALSSPIFFARHGITIKKKSAGGQSGKRRPDVARARRRWDSGARFLDPAHLVFIDETAVTTNIAGGSNGLEPTRASAWSAMPRWDTGRR